MSLGKLGWACSTDLVLLFADAHESVAKLQQMLMLLPALHASSVYDLNSALALKHETQHTLVAGAWSHMDTFGQLLHLLPVAWPNEVIHPGFHHQYWCSK